MLVVVCEKEEKQKNNRCRPGYRDPVAMPSLLEAIAEKYGCFEDDTFDRMPIAIYVPRKNPRNMIPNLLVLNDCDIDSAGHESDLRDKCHGVEELDLAQNRLSRWNEVSNGKRGDRERLG